MDWETVFDGKWMWRRRIALHFALGKGMLKQP